MSCLKTQRAGRASGSTRSLRVRSFDIYFVYGMVAGADLLRYSRSRFRIPKTIAARGFERSRQRGKMPASPEFLGESEKLVVNPYLRFARRFCNFVSQLMDGWHLSTYPVQRGARAPHEQQQRA
ncbi:MAG TPA: hypothetical protein VMJ11_00170 [Paraburkholderia sp.]|uniref:hypothetical protein n=1 Tax=Paraburkholderia sp. TaxID=1926495 RepID=UPI002B55FF5E|nr:hypothetical protein [Paraburkholderia sp.]HTR05093.1 hypothetical protein [Paraburkholderia sp.]